ncbi:MAG: RICIN domain-containing protein [Verrucomicrobiota bacterium]
MKRPIPILLVILALGVLVATLCLWTLRAPGPQSEADSETRGQAVESPSTARPDGPVFSQNAPAKHLPDRELFGSGWRTSPRKELAAFAEWTVRYLDAAPDARESLLGEGISLAETRRTVMAQLILTDPREALANTVPVLVRQRLPWAVQDLLEERVSDRGDVYRIMGIAGPGDKTVIPTIEQAQIGKRVFQAYRYGDRALTPHLKNVSLHGITLDGHLAILDSPVRKMEDGETAAETTEECVVTGGVVVAPEDPVTKEIPPAEITTMLVGNHAYQMCCPFCSEDFETRMERLERQMMSALSAVDAIAADADQPRSLSSSGVNGSADYPGKPPEWLTHGTNTMIFMRVDFPDYPNNGFTEQYLRDQVNAWGGVDFMVDRFSRGVSQVADPTITPVLRMPRNRGTYDNGNYWGDILNDAKAAAAALGYNADTFSCRVIVHDGFVSGGAAGWGGGGAIWCNGNASNRLLIHEYGHVFWLPHANSWTATDGNPLSDSRAHVEYGDASDPMGNAWGTNSSNDFNAYYKSLLGWLPDSSIVPVSHSGTYRINQFDGWGDWTKPVALKITRDNGLDLWVMFRGDGVPQGDYNTGAYVVGVNGERFGDSHVLDFNNPTGDSGNAPLAQGQTWTDSASGISITTAGRMMTDWPHHMYVKVDFPAGYTHGYRALVNGGIYALRNKSFNQFLTVPGNSSAGGVEPTVAAYNGNAGQQWVAQRNPEGNYSLKHNGTDKFLDVSNNGGGNYNEIVQWTWNGSDAQRWDVVNSWDGYLKFRHRNTNQLLSADTAGGNYGDVIQYDDFSGDEQKWEPYLIGINDGVYRMVPRHAQTRTMALRGRSGSAGTQVEQQYWAGGDWQQWTMQNLGNGQFRIHPKNQPGVTLGIQGGSTADGAKAVLETYTGANSQKFTFTSTGMGFVRLTPVHAPAMCLDVNASGNGAGVDIQQWTYLGGNNQQWRFIDSDL